MSAGGTEYLSSALSRTGPRPAPPLRGLGWEGGVLG